jgi:hypothetical protein
MNAIGTLREALRGAVGLWCGSGFDGHDTLQARHEYPGADGAGAEAG